MSSDEQDEFDQAYIYKAVIGWSDLHGEKGSDKESNMNMNYKNISIFDTTFCPTKL